ncbi:hypothetical protein CHCC20348_3099 [Bacillus paralicheniformis]|nr:hypothetical protein CHCC20348_3099 [Bacillus paralicheniformis]
MRRSSVFNKYILCYALFKKGNRGGSEWNRKEKTNQAPKP